MGWEMGVEPTTFGTTIRRSNQLNYAHHYVVLAFSGFDGAKVELFFDTGNSFVIFFAKILSAVFYEVVL